MCFKVPLKVLTHKQRVQSLYKRAVRNIESWYPPKEVSRYHATIMRARFDDNKCIQDESKARELVHLGEEELFSFSHPIPKKFPESPGGVSYQREVEPPDWVLDYWHPLEKARYPDYFRRREEFKRVYVELWRNKYMRKCGGGDDDPQSPPGEPWPGTGPDSGNSGS